MDRIKLLVNILGEAEEYIQEEIRDMMAEDGIDYRKAPSYQYAEYREYAIQHMIDDHEFVDSLVVTALESFGELELLLSKNA